MQKSLDNGLQSTSQAVCQFLNGFLFLNSLAKRLHWGSNPKSSLHTSLQQLTTAYWNSSCLVKQSTMNGITGLLECVLILFS